MILEYAYFYEYIWKMVYSATDLQHELGQNVLFALVAAFCG